jgi:hypothetical protein
MHDSTEESNASLALALTPVLAANTQHSNENLSLLFRRYIVPKIENVNQFRSAEQSEESGDPGTNSEMGEGKTLGRVRTYRVLHNQLIYASAATSRRILQSNRQTYERMMQKLQTLEHKKFVQAQRVLRFNKSKMDFLRDRVRAFAPELKCMSLVSLTLQLKVLAFPTTNVSAPTYPHFVPLLKLRARTKVKIKVKVKVKMP